MLTSAELTLWTLAFVSALYAGVHRSFLAVVFFLSTKLVTAATYSFITFRYTGTPDLARAYVYYYDVFWLMYLLGTIAAFFSIEQIMRKVLSPLPGVSRLAVIVFRFTGILTLVIATTAHLPELHAVTNFTGFETWLNGFFMSVALCMCVFEVSLMSLLIAAASRLGLSFRTRILGLSLGLCFLGLMDFLTVVTTSMSATIGAWAGLSLASELVVVTTLVMWIAYFVLPDQKRGELRLTRSSTLMRWNDIVNQLGIGPQPVPDMAPSFMTDVESVVERIMMRSAGRKM